MKLRLLLVGILLLTFPFILRAIHGDPLIFGAVSYEALARETSLRDPYSLLLSMIPPHMAVALSLLLGLATILLAHHAARPLKNKRVLVLALLLLNPAFLSVFTSLTPLAISIPLLLLALIYRHWLIALLAALFSPVFSLIFLGTVLFSNSSRKWVLTALLSAALALLLRWPPDSSSAGIAEFGVPFGLSAIFLFFALSEAANRWKKEKWVLSWLLFLSIASFFLSDAAVALSFLSVPYAAFFLYRLSQRKWALGQAKLFTLLLSGCLLLFLVLSYLFVLAEQQPNKSMAESMGSINDGVVLAPPELAPIILSLSGGTPLLTEHCGSECDDAGKLYRTTHLSEAQAILDRHEIRYILITPRMREGGVWSDEEEGLLFLLRHSRNFHIVSASDPELWEYIPADER